MADDLTDVSVGANPRSESAQRCSGTPELHALLVGYADELGRINSMPRVEWIRPERSLLLRWLPLPAPCFLARGFLIFNLHRCLRALKHGVGRRNAISVGIAAQERDLEMLEQFERSLPGRIRYALIWQLALLAVLLVSYCLAVAFNDDYSRFFGGLASAALQRNGPGVADAFNHFNRARDVSYVPELFRYASATVLLTWAAILLIAPSLPAFAVNRRARARLADREARAFAASGARAVYPFELDLIAWFLLLPTAGLPGILILQSGHQWWAAPKLRLAAVVTMVAIVLTLLAAFELGVRYARRRSNTQIRSHSLIGRIALSSATVMSLLVFATLPLSHHPGGPDVWRTNIASEAKKAEIAHRSCSMYAPNANCQPLAWIYDIHFMITNIEPNAPCNDETHGRLVAEPQFLRFDLETWSSVDEFAEPAAAHWLALNHWSVADEQLKVTANLYPHPACGRGREAIFEPVRPGSHTTTVVVVSAPKSGKYLQLTVPGYHATWQWDIPPAKT